MIRVVGDKLILRRSSAGLIVGGQSQWTRRQHTAISQAGVTMEMETKPFSEVPQPLRLPLIGTVLDYSKRRGFDKRFIHKFLENRHKQLGPIYKEAVIPGLSEVRVFSSLPEDNAVIFRNEGRMPIRSGGEFIGIAKEKSGIAPGVGMVQGEQWQRMRRIVNEFLLSKSFVWSYAEDHMEVAYELADYIDKNKDKNNEVPNFAGILNKWALEGTCIFALDSHCGFLRDDIDHNAKAILDSTNSVIKTWEKMLVSLPLWKYYNTKDMKALCGFQRQQTEAVLEHRKKMLEKVAEDVSSKLETQLEKSDLTHTEKMGLITETIGAGIDGSSKAATFVLYCLASYPEKQEILRKEVRELLRNGEKFTGKKLLQMKYMHAFNKEVQRMFPLVNGVVRKFPKEIVLSGYRIPPNVQVVLTSNLMNSRDEKYFEDPVSFIPERWMKGKTKERFVMNGSFGHGPRMCPGRMFALQQIYTMVIAVLSRYKVEYHHDPFVIQYNVINRPLQEPRFTFTPLR